MQMTGIFNQELPMAGYLSRWMRSRMGEYVEEGTDSTVIEKHFAP
jgi:hypothetical protein